MQQYLSFLKFHLNKHLLLRKVEKDLADNADWMRETQASGAGKSVNLVDYYVTKVE